MPPIWPCSSSCRRSPTIEAFSSANQVGVAQLAIQYCNEMVNTPAYLSQVLPGVTLSSQSVLLASRDGFGHRSARGPGLGQRVESFAAGHDHDGSYNGPGTSTGELTNLITKLCTTSACNTAARVQAVTAAVCATAFGSADMLIN